MQLTLNGLKVFEFIKKNSDTWVGVHQVVYHTGVDINAVGRWLRLLTKEKVLVRNDTFQAYLYKLAEGYEELQIGEKVNTALCIFQELETKKNNDQPQA